MQSQSKMSETGGTYSRLCLVMRAANFRNILVAVLFSTGCFIEFKPVFAATSASEYRALGLSYRTSERYSEAIAVLKKSVEIEPQNSSGRVMLGWTQHLAGQEDAAASSLVQALCREPTSVPALNALGIVYLVSGELTAAVAVHTWAAILEPENEIAYYNLSLAFHRLRLYGSAITTANKAATLEPTNPHPLLALAIAHWDNGDRPRAKVAYGKARNLDSRYGGHAFLAHLKKAGFSLEQIEITKQILSFSKI